jgi:hypothetical protein
MAEAKSRQKPAEQEQPARPDQDKPAAATAPPAAASDQPDPEWLALQDRARAGGDDAAQALLDAFERGVRAGVERAEAVRSEGGKASITTEDVAALTGVPLGTAPARPSRIILSEGVRHDLERLGKVTDPGTGYELEMDKDSGQVTVYERPASQPAEQPARRKVDVPVIGPGQEPQNENA